MTYLYPTTSGRASWTIQKVTNLKVIRYLSIVTPMTMYILGKSIGNNFKNPSARKGSGKLLRRWAAADSFYSTITIFIKATSSGRCSLLRATITKTTPSSRFLSENSWRRSSMTLYFSRS